MFVDYRKISDELHDKLKNKMKMFVTKYLNAKISDTKYGVKCKILPISHL